MPNNTTSPVNDAPLPTGKIGPDLLHELISRLPTGAPDLIVGPAIGEDAAVLQPGEGRLIVAKSDPITFATEEVGYYAVNVCANDLAVCGARPRFFLPTLLLPAEKFTSNMLFDLFDQIGRACANHGIVVVGGHTEVTEAVNKPVIAGSMLGDVAPELLVSSAGCQPGDRVVLAGEVPIEGISIIAREKKSELVGRGWQAAILDEAAEYLFDPGISVVAPALRAADARLVNAMHDPTEGGVITGLHELARAAGVSLEIDLDKIRIPTLGAALCDEYGLDPLGTIASGALLATARPEAVDDLLGMWGQLGWRGTVIGTVLDQGTGMRALRNGGECPFPRFQVDEITRLW